MTGMLHIPLARADPQFDTDALDYRGGNPATYLMLAFCYDSLLGPSAAERDGVTVPDYQHMQQRLATVGPDDDFRTWHVELRPGILSSAGNELTAEDVKWSLSRGLGLASMGSWRWNDVAGLASAEDIKITGSASLSLRLRAPNPHLDAYLFSAAPMLLDASASAQGSDTDPWALAWLARGATAGFGGYEVAGRDQRVLEFTVRDSAEDADLLTGASAERVASRADGLGFLSAYEHAYVAGLRCDEAAALRAQGREDIGLMVTRGGHSTIEMNYHRPPFDDRRVRHALSLATPYLDIIRDGFLGLAAPWRGPLPSYDSWQWGGRWPYATDRQAAIGLLRQAGYPSGFEASLYLPPRADAARIGEILQAAYSAVGVEVTLRDMRELPDGWTPPMYLRMECGHNFNEAVYDIAHDYVPLSGLAPGSAVREGIGSWFPRYPGSRLFEDKYRRVLDSATAPERRQRARDLQRTITRFAPCIFLAENLQINACTAAMAEWATDYSRRVVQTLQFQNCGTAYLPQA